MVWASLIFGPQHNFELSVHYFVVGSNVICTSMRSVFLLIYGQEIQNVVNQFSGNFLNPMQFNSRQVKNRPRSCICSTFYVFQIYVKKRIPTLNRIFSISLGIQLSMALVMQLMSAIRNHHEMLPSALPGNRENLYFLIPLVIYGIFVDSLYLVG